MIRTGLKSKGQRVFKTTRGPAIAFKGDVGKQTLDGEYATAAGFAQIVMRLHGMTKQQLALKRDLEAIGKTVADKSGGVGEQVFNHFKELKTKIEALYPQFKASAESKYNLGESADDARAFALGAISALVKSAKEQTEAEIPISHITSMYKHASLSV